MGIKANFTDADIAKKLDAAMATIEKRIISRLQYLGEMCVTHARSSGDYNDQTGNLRASIGYGVFKNGVMIRQGFDSNLDKSWYTETWTNIKSKKEHSRQVQGDGIVSGQALAKKIGSDSKGFTLVVVAGMNYAQHVENMGRDVLTSSEIIAKQYLPIMLNQLKRNINKALDSEL